MLTLLSDEKYAQAIAQTPQGVLIGFKKLCPTARTWKRFWRNVRTGCPMPYSWGWTRSKTPMPTGGSASSARRHS